MTASRHRFGSRSIVLVIYLKFPALECINIQSIVGTMYVNGRLLDPSRGAAEKIDAKLVFQFALPKLDIHSNAVLLPASCILANATVAMSPLKNLWMKWKMLKLPWRTTVLMGEQAAINLHPRVTPLTYRRSRSPG